MIPISQSSAIISLTSGQDTTQQHKIERVEVNIPYRTIVSYQLPTKSMEKELLVKEEAILNWGTSLQTSKIYPNMTHKAYKTIMIPKIGFSMTSTIFNPIQLQSLQIKADRY